MTDLSNLDVDLPEVSDLEPWQPDPLPEVPTLTDIISGARVIQYQTRAEWLAARTDDRFHLGSTAIGAILGLSQYRGPWDVYRSHCLGIRSESSSSPVMSRGLAMEPMLWARYRQQYQTRAIEPGHCRVLRGRWGVSPDALVYDRGLGWGVGEGKTIGLSQAHWLPREDTEIHGLAGLERWPMSAPYLAQCLAMCIATGLQYCDLFAAVTIDVDDPRCSIATEEYPEAPPTAVVRYARIRVIPTAEDIAGLTEKVGSWVARHLVNGEPPPVDGSDACWLHHLGESPEQRETRRPATSSEAVLLAELVRLRKARDTADQSYRTLAAGLVAAMGDARTVYAKTSTGGSIKATITARGHLTVKET